MDKNETRLLEIESRLVETDPAPWLIEEDPDCYETPTVLGATASEICTCLHYGTPGGKSNAKLIANAPQDLRWAVDRIKELEEEVRRGA